MISISIHSGNFKTVYIISNQYVQTVVLISDQYLYYFCNRYLWLLSKQMCTGHQYSIANNCVFDMSDWYLYSKTNSCVFDISDQYLYIPVYMLFFTNIHKHWCKWSLSTRLFTRYLISIQLYMWYLWSISGHLQYLLLIHTPLCKITRIGLYIQVYTYK